MRLIRLAAVMFGALAAMAAPGAGAADYPDRAIKIVNAWPPGGPADLVGRPMAEVLSRKLGQPVVMENKPGANGTIGAAIVAAAPPDGYTILLAHIGPTVISPVMQMKLPYDPWKAFTPITQGVSGPILLMVRPELPIRSVPDLISYLKANPGKLSYASVGTGSTTHFAGEMVKIAAGADMLHVPFKGSTPAVNEMLAGRIDVMFINISGGLGFVRQGQLRGLAVTTLERSSVLPELPTMNDTIPGFELNSWYGFLAPAGTPPDIVNLLSREMAAIFRSPEIGKLLRENGLEPVGNTPEEYGKRIQADRVFWEKVVRETGVKDEG